MSIRIWRFTITVNTNCAECDFPRRNGRHATAGDCQLWLRRDGRSCEYPHEHHSFRWI